MVSRFHKTLYLSIFNNYHTFSKIQEEYLLNNSNPKKTFCIPLNLKHFGSFEKKK